MAISKNLQIKRFSVRIHFIIFNINFSILAAMNANVQMPLSTVKDMIREIPFQKMGKRWIDQYPYDLLLHELTDKVICTHDNADNDIPSAYRCNKSAIRKLIDMGVVVKEIHVRESLKYQLPIIKILLEEGHGPLHWARPTKPHVHKINQLKCENCESMLSPYHPAISEIIIEFGHSRLRTIEYLLIRGADPNETSTYGGGNGYYEGYTALHWAVRIRSYELINLLLRFNANPTIADIHGRMPYQVALFSDVKKKLKVITKAYNKKKSPRK